MPAIRSARHGRGGGGDASRGGSAETGSGMAPLTADRSGRVPAAGGAVGGSTSRGECRVVVRWPVRAGGAAGGDASTAGRRTAARGRGEPGAVEPPDRPLAGDLEAAGRAAECRADRLA